MNGTDVASEAPCDDPPPPEDCRTTGCPEGEYCAMCWGPFICIPEGAVC